MNTVKKFYEALRSDENLQEKARVMVEKYRETEIAKEAAQTDIINLARAAGYHFSPEELAAYTHDEKPLSEEELQSAAGGMMPWAYDQAAAQVYSLQRAAVDKDRHLRDSHFYIGKDENSRKRGSRN